MTPPDDETWCVLYTETGNTDYDLFDCETDAVQFAHGILAHGRSNGIALTVYVTQVHWEVQG